MPTSTTGRRSETSLIPLSFGIELEHVLAFHSSLLTPLLPANTSITKHIPHATRLRLRQTTYIYQLSRPIYHGWGLTAPTSYPSPFGKDWYNQCIKDYGYRGYADEILRVEHDIFHNNNRDVVVHDRDEKMQKFDKWYLTTDTSLVGASPEELGSIIGEDRAKTGHWDSGPLELVSRVLDVDAATSFAEIAEMFKILDAGRSGKTRYKAFADQWCGLHVHIGLPPSSSIASTNPSPNSNEEGTFPLPLLQHLAYITIIYEPILSLLHPLNRRPEHPDAKTDLLGNREGFYAEPDYSAIDWDAVDSGYASVESDDSGELTLEFPTDPRYRKDKGKSWDLQTQTQTQRVEEISTANKQSAQANHKRKWDDDHCDVFEHPTKKRADDSSSTSSTSDPNSPTNLRHRAQTLIFPPETHKSHPMTISKLCHLMHDSDSDRRRLINWLYLLRDPSPSSSASPNSTIRYDEKGRPRAKGPQTLEFRQHEATFDAREVEMWVRFCAGLVRWGERGARAHAERFGEREHVDVEEAFGRMGRDKEIQDAKEEWFQDYYGRGEVGVEMLVERMGLGEEMKEWVWGRVRLWRAEEE
ncbi:MAG: hypothetical protein LQ337_005055 [Flavoplaca oasis]|nr:MAG: hypothetical protein LQ337_005055 [Flavoplaca oasis]